jgi:hypothetical protein
MEVMMPDPDKRGRVNLGWGHYGGVSALGITAAGRITDDMAYWAGVASDTSFEEVGGKVGISVQW